MRDNLEAAFCKAFSLVFEHGTAILEKTYNGQTLSQDYAVRDYALQVKGGRRELRSMDRAVQQQTAKDLLLTTVEGVGLGVLGVGLPDVVLFVAMVLRGVYETALQYGFSYDEEEDRYLILHMLETAMLDGDSWDRRNHVVDLLLEQPEVVAVTRERMQKQLEATASAFANDLLLMKFVQGIPLVGILGGVGNPVYYHRIMRYVQLKYRKKYLLMAIGRENQEE